MLAPDDYGDKNLGEGTSASFLIPSSTDAKFASNFNIDQCAQYINQSATSLGLCPDYIDFKEKDDDSIASILNLIFLLLSKRQNDMAAIDKLSTDVHKYDLDVKRLQLSRDEWIEKFHMLDKQNAVLESRLEKQKAAHDADKCKLERLLDESRKAYAQLSHRDTQYHAKMRRDEMAYEKLQKNMQTAVKGKDRGVKTGLEIADKALARLKALRGKDSLTCAATVREDFDAMVSRAYDAKTMLLMDENRQLRDMTGKLRKEIDTLSQSINQSAMARLPCDPVKAGPVIKAGQAGNIDLVEDTTDDFPCLELPLSLASGDGCELPAMLQALRNQVEKLQAQARPLEAAAESIDDGIECEQLVSLRRQVSEMKFVIAEQDRLLQAAILGRDDSGHLFSPVSTDSVDFRYEGARPVPHLNPVRLSPRERRVAEAVPFASPAGLAEVYPGWDFTVTPRAKAKLDSLSMLE